VVVVTTLHVGYKHIWIDAPHEYH